MNSHTRCSAKSAARIVPWCASLLGWFAVLILLSPAFASAQGSELTAAADSAVVESFRYMESRYSFPSRGSIRAAGITWLLDVRGRPLPVSAANIKRIARAADLHISSVESVCELEEGGLLYSAGVESITDEAFIIYATYSSRTRGDGWGSATHRLRITRSVDGWQVIQIEPTLNFHGECGLP
jgi:hypothetical protein